MSSKKRWIWQHENYPNFTYNQHLLSPLLLEIKYYQGLLDGIYKMISEEELSLAKLEILTTEALDTSAIEGEILNRDSVRSSLANRLGVDIKTKDSSNIKTDGVVDILLDATVNYKKKFDYKRLFGWHNALFPSGYNSIIKINVAQLRGKEDMHIVSGPIGKEKIHYIAPPRENLENEMDIFFKWLNDDSDLSIIKAGIAHLWFVIIHPMDDGNGRIARALTDMLLSRSSKQPYKMYSLSNAIKNDKKGYYDVLESVTQYNIDISIWLEWFLNTLLKSLKNSKNDIDIILQKTMFWNRHRETSLNARQKKVLNKLLDIGSENFQGGMNTRKYAAITKISKPTASRELKDLVVKGCLEQISGTAGRSVSYAIKLVPV